MTLVNSVDVLVVVVVAGCANALPASASRQKKWVASSFESDDLIRPSCSGANAQNKEAEGKQRASCIRAYARALVRLRWAYRLSDRIFRCRDGETVAWVRRVPLPRVRGLSAPTLAGPSGFDSRLAHQPPLPLSSRGMSAEARKVASAKPDFSAHTELRLASHARGRLSHLNYVRAARVSHNAGVNFRHGHIHGPDQRPPAPDRR
jgi:hypothetical protein